MKSRKQGALVAVLLTATFLMGCLPVVGPAIGDSVPVALAGRAGGGGGGRGKADLAGNNLSYPVLWADDPMASFAPIDGGSRSASVTKLEGTWWYWIGIVDEVPVVVYPSEDLVPGTGWLKAFEQQDENNIWTADAKTWGEYLNTPPGDSVPVLDVSYMTGVTTSNQSIAQYALRSEPKWFSTSKWTLV